MSLASSFHNTFFVFFHLDRVIYGILLGLFQPERNQLANSPRRLGPTSSPDMTLCEEFLTRNRSSHRTSLQLPPENGCPKGALTTLVDFRCDRVSTVAMPGRIVSMSGFARCYAPPTFKSLWIPCSSSLVGHDKTVPVISFS